MEEIRRNRPRLFMILDNASYHKSKAVRAHVESAGGYVELEFLPPYTPQLNPVETVWRDLKRRLAGRFFRSLDELKAAITAILEREMGNRLKGYIVAQYEPSKNYNFLLVGAHHLSVPAFIRENCREMRKMSEGAWHLQMFFARMSGLLWPILCIDNFV